MVAITQNPANARSTVDGILFTVTGEVAVPSHIAIKDAAGVVRGVSPVFSQGRHPTDVSNHIFTIEIVGASGGNFDLTFDDDVHDPVSALAIPYAYTDDDLEEAIVAAFDAIDEEDRWLASGVEVYAFSDDGVTTVELKGAAGGIAWDVAGVDHLTPGGATITVLDGTEENGELGGVQKYEDDGPYVFGPLYLDSARANRLYLYADEDGEDSDGDEIEAGDLLATLAIDFA